MDNIVLQDVSRETLLMVDQLIADHFESLDRYVDRLLWWNHKVNVVSRDLDKDAVWLHVKHSLMLAPLVGHSFLDRWVDTGTGGGLPGIPLAIVLPEKAFVLNDVVEKKGVVLKDLIVNLGLKNTQVRIVDMADFIASDNFGVVTKHAFKIPDLLRRLHGKPWIELLMLKGADYTSELADVSGEFFTVEATSLQTATPKPFYDGKYLIRICPK